MELFATLRNSCWHIYILCNTRFAIDRPADLRRISYTRIHWACERRNEEIVKYIKLEYYATFNVRQPPAYHICCVCVPFHYMYDNIVAIIVVVVNFIYYAYVHPMRCCSDCGDINIHIAHVNENYYGFLSDDPLCTPCGAIISFPPPFSSFHN